MKETAFLQYFSLPRVRKAASGASRIGYKLNEKG